MFAFAELSEDVEESIVFKHLCGGTNPTDAPLQVFIFIFLFSIDYPMLRQLGLESKAGHR